VTTPVSVIAGNDIGGGNKKSKGPEKTIRFMSKTVRFSANLVRFGAKMDRFMAKECLTLHDLFVFSRNPSGQTA